MTTPTVHCYFLFTTMPKSFVTTDLANLPFFAPSNNAHEWMASAAMSSPITIMLAPVLGLFSMRCPPKVARFVTSIIINPIKAVLRRWRITDFGVERWKIQQLRSYCNASSRVIADLVRASRIQAARLHVLPSAVDFRYSACRAFAMFCDALQQLLFLQTSATLASTIKQCLLPRSSHIAAVTSTDPSLVSVLGIRGSCYNHTAAKSLSNQIFNRGHAREYRHGTQSAR